MSTTETRPISHFKAPLRRFQCGQCSDIPDHCIRILYIYEVQIFIDFIEKDIVMQLKSSNIQNSKGICIFII